MLITPTHIILPLTNVPDAAFYRCVALERAEFENVRTIGSEAFAYCSALEHAKFGYVRYVCAFAFLQCPMRFRNATLRREVTP